MNQLLRRRKKASLIDKKVCRESARLHAVEASRLWSVILDSGQLLMTVLGILILRDSCSVLSSQQLWGWIFFIYFFLLPPKSDLQGTKNYGKHIVSVHVNLLTLGTDLPFSQRCENKRLMSLGEQVFTPALEGQARSTTTPWQCLFDLPRAAPVPEALLSSSRIDCGHRKFVRRATGSLREQKTEGR